MPRWAVVILSVVAGVAVILVLGFFVFGTGEEVAGPAFGTTTEETTTEAEVVPTVPVTQLRVTVRDGAPIGGVQHAVASQGGPVVVRVVSDVQDHVHVHGYDLMRDVAPGRPAVFRFDAMIAGRFEIELEDRGTPIAELEVRP